MTDRDIRTLWLTIIISTMACASAPAETATDWTVIAMPFIWRDLLCVGVWAAVPLAWFVSRWWLSESSLLFRGGSAIALAMLASGAILGLQSMEITSFATGAALRALVSISIAIAAAAISSTVLYSPQRKPVSTVSLIVSVVAWLLLPMVYVTARLHHDVQSLLDLAGQSRFVEARDLARSCRRIYPSRLLPNQRTLSQYIVRLDQAVQQLEARVTPPLPDNASLPMQLERVQLWLMLGKIDRALAILDTLGADHPEVCELYALIAENREDWAEACLWYARSEAAWKALPTTSDQTAGMLQACRGRGYCERKRGRYRDAEAAYQRLLAGAPTADTHFLLAQFYEDTQQPQPAEFHARRGMELSPSRYATRGRQLLTKLSTHHFGCLGMTADPPHAGRFARTASMINSTVFMRTS